MVRVHRNIFVLSISLFFLLVATFTWLNLFPIYLKELGASDYEVGVSYSFFFLAIYAFSFVGGFLTDTFGRARMITLPTFLFPVLYGLMVLIPDWRTTAFFFFLGNIAGSLQGPAFTALMAESSENRERVFTYLNAFASLGLGVGSYLGAFLVNTVGIRRLIGATALVALLVAIFRQRLLVEPASSIATRKQASSDEPAESFRDIFLSLFRQKALLFYLLTSVLLFFMLSLTANGPFISLHFKDVLKKSEGDINRFFATGWLVAGVVNLLGLPWIQKWKARPLLQLSLVAYPALLVFWALAGDSPASTTLFIISFIFNVMIYSMHGVLLSDLTRQWHRGRITGLFFTLTGLLSFTGPTMGTALKMRFGSQAPFLLSFLFGILSSLLLFILKVPERSSDSQ